MKSDRLNEAFQYIEDEYLDKVEAEAKKAAAGKPSPGRKKALWASLAAAAVVVLAAGAVLLGGRLIGSMGNGSGAGAETAAGGAGEGSGREGGRTYMSYAGPVFPLSAPDGAPEAVEAERQLDFDFSPYENRTYTYDTSNGEESYERYEAASMVTDAYTLFNTSDEDVTLTLAYPAVISLRDSLRVLPEITVDGQPAETEMQFGSYAGKFADVEGNEAVGAEALNLLEPQSWEEYKAMIEGGCLDELAEPEAELRAAQEQTVFVYTLTDVRCADGSGAIAPTISMEFYLDAERTHLLTYLLNGMTYDAGSGKTTVSGFVPDPENADAAASRYLIVMGDDIGPYEIKGYKNGDISTGNELEGVSAEITREEMTLRESIAMAAGEYFGDSFERVYGDASDMIASKAGEETCTRLAMDLIMHEILSEDPIGRYGSFASGNFSMTGPSMLDELFTDVIGMRRIMRKTFEVTIPAGGKTEIVASMWKQASFDFYGAPGYEKGDGFDLVTQLGSDLVFRSQTVSVSHTEFIEIVAQDLGLDPEKGVTSAELDLSRECFYLEVRKKE